ncbi:PAS domain-containing protein [Marivibrio halodurans]|uniref:PAS domain-containing protein n=1 Tax=Marivibrio halodurans TaxID=2039722 RepID=A0A8J7S5N5_9PROT|nr:PAS domain-containing protein [Marivibrio halodurans]MBP5856027.1 PAS domain-containing protein [Marivibrio halodurans]
MPIWSTADKVTSEKVLALDAYWRARLGNGPIPCRKLFDPSDLRDLLPNILIVEFADDPWKIRYRLIGTKVVEMSRLDFTGRRLDECAFQTTDEDIWYQAYKMVGERSAPVYGRATIPIEGADNQHVTEEFGIFPLTHDGTAIHQCIAIEDYTPIDRLIPPDRIRPMRMR